MKNWKKFLEIYCANENKASTLFHKYISKNLAKVLVYFSLNFNLSANTLSFLSTITLLIGSILSLKQQNILYVLILSQISYALDCSDGVVARINGTSSTKGKFLDLILDRINQLVFAWGIILFSYFNKDEDLSLILQQSLMFSLYFMYSSTAMIRGLVMKTKRGEGSKKIKNPLVKVPYEFIDTGVFMFIVSIASILNVDLLIAYFYCFIITLLSIGIISITLKNLND
jgi:phosphatidylglycerophosphate synthase